VNRPEHFRLGQEVVWAEPAYMTGPVWGLPEGPFEVINTIPVPPLSNYEWGQQEAYYARICEGHKPRPYPGPEGDAGHGERVVIEIDGKRRRFSGKYFRLAPS
jgi:hypothetical protein